MIEGFFWKNRDPHKIAMDWGRGSEPKRFDGFRSEAGQRAAEIGARLGIKDVTTATRCIGCHSVLVPAGTPRQDFSDPLAEGVTCVACHGPFRRWVIEHTAPEDPTWRGLTRREKWTKYGMVDLWDPVVRAQTCMSCHIGDPDPRAGRAISHAMYAAGHPPLPSIEVAAFSEEQPQHWLYLRCKEKQLQERLGFYPGRLEQTEQVAASGLVALSREMELFEAVGRAPRETSTWPEFARFDCYPCHHELRSPGGEVWRRARARGVGRPSGPAWPTVLVDLGLDAAEPEKSGSRKAQLAELLERFHAALTDRPFGDPETASAKARDIVELLRTPLAELSQLATVKPGEKRRILDRHEARRLLRILGDAATKDLQDYESARQIGWAFRTIDRELREVTSRQSDDHPALKLLGENQPRIQGILKDLDSDLVLSLRERGSLALGACPPTDRIMEFPKEPDQKPIIGVILDTRLRKRAEYDPVAFQRRLTELSRLIPSR
jgi:hypothetical protein